MRHSKGGHLCLPAGAALEISTMTLLVITSLPRETSDHICVWVTGRRRAGQGWKRLRQGRGVEGDRRRGCILVKCHLLCHQVSGANNLHYMIRTGKQIKQLLKWGNQSVPGSRLWEDLSVSFINWRNAFRGALSKYAYLITPKAQSLST